MKQQIPVTRIYEETRDSLKPIIINQGGARSSKSYSVGQLLVEKFINQKNKKILITRKTLPSLRITAYKLILDLLEKYGFLYKCKHNKSERTLKLGSNFILFTSIDDKEKIKSTEWNYIWMEEVNEFNFEDFLILYLRLSAETYEGEPNQLYMTFNPSDLHGWIKEKIIDSEQYKDEIELIRSNYKDNPFLDDEYIRKLNSLKEKDLNYYKIYAEGEWGVLGEYIFNPFLKEEKYPRKSVFQEIIYGLDFGFNNPSALIEVGIINEQDIHTKELLYESNLTNQDLINHLYKLIPYANRKFPIYADSAEPARIEDLRRVGFSVFPADKNVLDGIIFMKHLDIYTTDENPNLNMERSKYSWRKDKNGNILDEPIDMFNHLLSGLRYALYTHLGKRKTKQEAIFFHRSWLKRYIEITEFKQIIQCWVSSFMTKSSHDFCICSTWEIKENNYFLLDVKRQKMSYGEFLNNVYNSYKTCKDLYGINPEIVIIEDTRDKNNLGLANDLVLHEEKMQFGIPLVAFDRPLDDILHANSCGKPIEEGRINVPKDADWLLNWIEEHEQFPEYDFKNQVLSSIYFLQWIEYSKVGVV